MNRRDPTDPLRGRGSRSGPSGRFERFEVVGNEFVQTDEFDLEPSPRLPTEFFRDHSRSIIARNDSPDVGFEASVS